MRAAAELLASQSAEDVSVCAAFALGAIGSAIIVPVAYIHDRKAAAAQVQRRLRVESQSFDSRTDGLTEQRPLAQPELKAPKECQ